MGTPPGTRCYWPSGGLGWGLLSSPHLCHLETGHDPPQATDIMWPNWHSQRGPRGRCAERCALGTLTEAFFSHQLDILCNEEILGKDHTLKFVVVTRWRFKVRLWKSWVVGCKWQLLFCAYFSTKSLEVTVTAL